MSSKTGGDEADIERLYEEISYLRSERERLSSEVEHLLEERNRYNEEFKRGRDLVKELKQKRDAVNSRVQELKRKRDEARREASLKRQEIREVFSQLSQIKLNPKGKSRETAAELERLEWKIQTTSMRPEEERALISRIAELEERLRLQERVENLRMRLRELRKSVKELDERGDSLHEELMKTVEESESYHGEMMKLVEESSKIKSKADEAHKKFVEAKNALRNIQDRYIALLATVKSLKKREAEARRKGKEEKLEELRRRLESEAEEKLRRGAKLSFDEFKILVEKGKI
jgi:phosphoserine phosphatase